MNTVNMDRRVRKTRNMLRKGLSQLLREKPAKDITVRELSTLVDINRGTFYLHYRDIYDMVEQIENEMFEEFQRIIDTHKSSRLMREPLPTLLDVFRYLADNADMCAVLLGKHGDAAFVERLKSLIRDKCAAEWKKSAVVDNEAFVEYRIVFYITGCVGIFERWLNSGMKETPEDMARLADVIMRHSIETFVQPLRV